MIEYRKFILTVRSVLMVRPQGGEAVAESSNPKNFSDSKTSSQIPMNPGTDL
jgi:hypothetical protein